MADISKIKVGSTTYDIKDATARSNIATQSSQITSLQSDVSTQSSQIANIQDLLNSFNDFLRGIIPAEYSTSTTYAVGAVCCHNNRLYQATQTTSGTWNASHWTQVRINNVAVLSYAEV